MAKEEQSPKALLDEAKTELKSFMKENSLKEDSEPTDKKIAKQFRALQEAVVAARKVFKASKASAGRKSTYDYPADVTDAKAKKKYRTKMRAEAAKAAKGEKPAKASKASVEEEAPVKKKKKQVVESDD